MATTQQITVPDIGDFSDIPVIEILVAPGDAVDVETPLVSLESDKATMDVPSPVKGVVKAISVGVGDTVSQGSPILVIEVSDGAAAAPAEQAEQAAPAAGAPPEPPPAAAGTSETIVVTVPDIGDFSDIPVIEILVTAGDAVEVETPLVSLESDKATMDVPSPAAGTVARLLVTMGDTVSQGSPILELTAGAVAAAAPGIPAVEPPATDPAPAPTPEHHPAADPGAPASRPSPTADVAGDPGPPKGRYHATPAVRRLARELGVDLLLVTGTGRKGRILQGDVNGFVKHELTSVTESHGTSMGIPPIPAVDFAKFGEVETQALSRIKRLSGPHLHRAWLNIPHVTHHDEADITELEAFRQSLKEEAAKRGVRVTPLAFMMKALAAALREHPAFNASLSSDGANLILKKYFHIGVAVDTPNGLMVPVVRDVDRKGIVELAGELAEISARARDGKLKSDEMQGGCMSISSLGGIGGTAFTPIVNAPEVAILGVTRSRMTPVWDGAAFVPRLMLPLDLSYDHRVVDGAQAARFMAFLCGLLGDVRRLLL